MQEFKVGDRFSVEGVVTALADREGDCRALFDGHDSDCKVIGAEMAHAKLIEPAVKAAEEKALDLSKPIRRKDNLVTVPYLGLTSSWRVITEDEGGNAFSLHQKELENIPEPKKTVIQEVNLHEYANGSRFFAGYVSCAALISKARITHTEGEGWSIEEVE